jgi:leucyl aminopeptidase
MILPILEVKAAPAKGADTDIVAVYQDAAKKAIPPKGPYLATVGKFRKSEGFGGRSGSVQSIPFAGKGGVKHALFVGMGPAGELTEEKARNAGGNAFQKLLAEKSTGAVVRLDSLFNGRGLDRDLTETRLARAFAEGLLFGAYKYDKHKSAPQGDSKDKVKSSKNKAHGPSRITFVLKDKVLTEQVAMELAIVQATAEAMRVTRDWSNEPSNHGTPEYFAADAKRLAKEYGLKCTILTEADAAKEKMGLFLGVGQGSDVEGRIVVLEYTPKKVAGKNPQEKSKDMKTIAFVGKGVTFDSGGISIKPSMKMEDMKHDMTGAATVMGGILLASQMKIQNRIIAIMAFTENMPGGNAIQPGNVLTSRAGKTVEIINTDAEGRLVLADVLDYAQDFKPDAIVDVATLTGAVMVALGKMCCGIMGNDEELIQAVRRAGEDNGERVWQLPLFDEYFDDLRSDYADMKNSANDPLGGTIRGAIFLKQFIKKGVRWAHLDIAATAWSVTHLSYIPKRGASGLFVRTLAKFASDFS